MEQHPAAQKYEDILDKVENLHKQMQNINDEFTEIKKDLYLLNKIHRDYVKEVIGEFNKENEVEKIIKRYKKIVSKLSITTKNEDLDFLQTDILGLLSYYILEEDTQEK